MLSFQKIHVVFLFVFQYTSLFAQDIPNTLEGQIALPFLFIAADALSASAGETGVSTHPDSYSMHWNAAKYAFMAENSIGVSVTPWKRQLVSDMNLFYISGAFRASNVEYLAASFKYFTLGRTYFTDSFGNETSSYQPSDLSIDFAYIRKLSPVLSLSTTFKYIRSDIITFDFAQNQGTVANTVAADVGLYFTFPVLLINKKNSLSFGSSLSNIGPKIKYNSLHQSIGTSFRLGSSMTTPLNDLMQMRTTIELNTIFHNSIDRTPNVGFGVDMLFINSLSFRGGYYNTNDLPEKGKYLTSGAGFKYQNFSFSSSYLFPLQDISALNNTFRLSLEYNFKKQTRNSM